MMRLTVFILLALMLGCNKDTLQISKEQVAKIEEEQREENQILQPKNNCQPKELIRNTNPIEGYCDKQSYFPGEIVFFYIHSRTPQYKVSLYKFGSTQQLIYTENLIDGKIQNYLCYAYSWGCDWISNYNYSLPSNIESGFYSLKLENENGSSWITFIVKPTVKKAEIGLIASTFTLCAYNDWGGGSFYTNRIEQETPVSENITFMRPNPSASPFENSHLAGSELHLINWLDIKQVDFEMFADVDLHETPDLLTQYKILIIQTHPEYYSENMFFELEEYVKKGGRLLYLGANGIYAKVVYNPTLKRLETRKKGTYHYYDNSLGGLWRALGKPESEFLGVQYDTRGYNTYKPYKLINDSHWIFSGTNLKKDDLFGNNCTRGGASGHETDKITTFSPKNVIHLAKGTNPEAGGADMIYYENANGGKVFSVGSITYTSCINQDPVISQITENVLTEFLK